MSNTWTFGCAFTSVFRASIIFCSDLPRGRDEVWTVPHNLRGTLKGISNTLTDDWIEALGRFVFHFDDSAFLARESVFAQLVRK